MVEVRAVQVAERGADEPVVGADPPLVICLDDEPLILRSLALVLRSEYRVATATTATEALDLVDDAEAPPAAIVSDLRLPDIDGVVVLERLRWSHPSAGRLLISGHADEAEVSAARASGVDEILLKPFRAADVLALLRSHATTAAEPAPLTAAARRVRRLAQTTRSAIALATARSAVLADLLGPGPVEPELLGVLERAQCPVEHAENDQDSDLSAAVDAALAAAEGEADQAVLGFARSDACSARARQVIDAWADRRDAVRAVRVPLAAAPTDAVLATHLITDDGLLLAPRGTQLTAWRLERLHRSSALADAHIVVYTSPGAAVPDA